MSSKILPIQFGEEVFKTKVKEDLPRGKYEFIFEKIIEMTEQGTDSGYYRYNVMLKVTGKIKENYKGWIVYYTIFDKPWENDDGESVNGSLAPFGKLFAEKGKMYPSVKNFLEENVLKKTFVAQLDWKENAQGYKRAVLYVDLKENKKEEQTNVEPIVKKTEEQKTVNPLDDFDKML